MGFFILLSFLLPPSLSFQDVRSKLKIGVKHEVKNCKRFIEDNDYVYAHVVARVEGGQKPVLDTYQKGKPLYLKVNSTQYIEGFNIGLRGACEGEIRRITIPPELAYKGESVEGLFEPHSTWIVDAEILEIIKEQTL